MALRTLYNKVWDSHKVATLPTGQDQIFIGLHLIHEVTSPQAFSMLRESGGTVAFPDRSFATVDHIVPTDDQQRPFSDSQAELMVATLEGNVKEFGIRYFGIPSKKQGVVHIIGPELGLTQPGMTIACGDSHTSTHGAFGSLAFGIGTTEVRDVLETQSLALDPLKVRKIDLSGTLDKGVYAKDVILKIIQILGVKGGLGYAYEYAGEGFHKLNMEERMTVCNMSIEGGTRIGYLNPDQTTFDYLKDREYAPAGKPYEKAVEYWKSVASEEDAEYDDVVNLKASKIDPIVTWGINPGQSVGVRDNLPKPEDLPDDQRKTVEEAFAYMKLQPGKAIYGTPIDVAFIGSCTNARISDLREVAKVLEGEKISPNVKTFIVPGSQQVKEQAEKEGLHKIFEAAGANWRGAGCSMCLAMNPDKLVGDQMCASSSNRNFIGRQGSSTGRTLLMSPVMVAASAIGGKVSDPRDYL